MLFHEAKSHKLNSMSMTMIVSYKVATKMLRSYHSYYFQKTMLKGKLYAVSRLRLTQFGKKISLVVGSRSI